jgi:uncharacterized protein YdhG (YjbR/CyaY superfamily)
MPAKNTAASKKSRGFTDEEKAAMRERAREMKGEVDGETAVLAKIHTMTGSDRAMAERLHFIIKANAPDLMPKTWYGMPAYSNKDGKMVCFFQDARKFKMRYATLGFGDKANLDEGHMWPVYFALTELTATEEVRIIALLKKAMG